MNKYKSNRKKKRLRRIVLGMLNKIENVDFFSRQTLVRNLPFIIFLTFLGLVYIYNRHHAERVVRNMNKIEKELVELQWHYETMNDELSRKSRQSEIARKIEGKNIHELREPVKVIEIERAKH